MRFLTLPTLTILAGGLLLAADTATVTYIDGNIADLTPNSGANPVPEQSAGYGIEDPSPQGRNPV